MREWLKNSRKEKGITMSELASKLDISESYYCLIENGERQKRTISFEFWLKFLFIATGFSVLATWTWEFLFVPIFEYILDLIRHIRKILKHH